MTLIYKFKKEKLDDGRFVSRPRILVELSGKEGSVVVPALVDSGSDSTVIPHGIAKALGLILEEEVTKFYAYHEHCDVAPSKVVITFTGKEPRQSVRITIPVLVTIHSSPDEESDIILGLDGIFEAFDVTFRKTANRIILKQVSRNRL